MAYLVWRGLGAPLWRRLSIKHLTGGRSSILIVASVGLPGYGFLILSSVNSSAAAAHLILPTTLNSRSRSFLDTMSKRGASAAVDQVVKLIVGAGQASPSPPVGPALGSKGVKSMDFCKVSAIVIDTVLMERRLVFMSI